MPSKNTPGSIQTFSGRFFDPFFPKPEDVYNPDIVHALSLQCRFSGHLRWHYTVAAHSLLVEDLCSTEHKRVARSHDKPEAYLVDLPRPIKRDPQMWFYNHLEKEIWAAIAEAQDLPYEIPMQVKHADNLALVAEARVLLHGTDHLDTWPELAEMDTREIERHPLLRKEYHWSKIERMFLKREGLRTRKWFWFPVRQSA